jgi:hypothetical protein
MAYHAAARNAGEGSGAYRYQRHQPEQTLLYQIVEQHFPAFIAHLAAHGGECGLVGRSIRYAEEMIKM